MSKIFEGLSRLPGGLPEVVSPVLREVVPEADPDAPVAQLIDPAPSAAAAAEASQIPQNTASTESTFGLRTQRFRIPSPSPLLPFDGGNWRASEQYRVLRTKILQHPGKPRMIVLSSPGPRDGKTVTALNLAAALSLKSDAAVLLVDCDFRRSSIHRMLGLPAAPGLAEVLSGRCTLGDALAHSEEFEHLCVLPAGTPSCNPAELLDSGAWASVTAELKKFFGHIVIDSPPVGAVTDYDLIQAKCDAVVLVLRPDHTKRGASFDTLAAVPKDKLIGIVLNCVPEWVLGTKHDHAHDYYYSDK